MGPGTLTAVSVRAVLLDFAGTLLVPVPARRWAASVLGEDVDPALVERLVAAGRAGGPEPDDVPPHLTHDYARRDVSAELHRAVYTQLLARVDEVDADTAAALYDASCTAAGWEPYPDTRAVLAALRERGVAVVVVSNVGFDLRVLFDQHGLADLVDVFVQSYELGVMKPDAAIFASALEAAGVLADQALMVGDNPRADGAAADVGIRTLLLPYSPPGVEHGLATVLDLVR